ncbi:MAG TPA: hypothetical protein VF026_26800 [Ktedonobacteraceae bacterium]
MSWLLDTSEQPGTPGLRSTWIRGSPRIHELMLKRGASWLHIDGPGSPMILNSS